MILIITCPEDKTGKTMFTDNGKYLFNIGNEWVEIVSKEHHEELIEKYSK